MKVVFDHRIFATQRYGGVSRYFAELTTRLPAYGCEPKVLAPLHVNNYLRDLPSGVVVGRLVNDGVMARRVAKLAGALLTGPLASALRPAVVHETFYGRRGVAPQGATTVVTVHDMISEIFEDNPDNLVERKKFKSIMRADAIICVSEQTKADLLRYLPSVENRISVIHHGVDASRFSNPVRQSRGSKPFVAYVGGRGGYKNFNALIEAFASSKKLLNTFDLVCIGGGPFQPHENARMAQAGIIEIVRHVQGGDESLRHAYGHAELLVYPSLYEGFGLPPIEAMAAGCPVLAAKTGAVIEVCGDAAEYADDGSAEALAVHLERLLFDPERRDELRAAGKLRASKFSWDRAAGATAEVYRNLI